MFMKIWGRSKGPVKYSSAKTRVTSLDRFLGGAQGDEVWSGLDLSGPKDACNLEDKFQSGVNRTDCPSAWGALAVDRRVANVKFSLLDEISGWLRVGGRPKGFK